MINTSKTRWRSLITDSSGWMYKNCLFHCHPALISDEQGRRENLLQDYIMSHLIHGTWNRISRVSTNYWFYKVYGDHENTTSPKINGETKAMCKTKGYSQLAEGNCDCNGGVQEYCSIFFLSDVVQCASFKTANKHCIVWSSVCCLPRKGRRKTVLVKCSLIHSDNFILTLNWTECSVVLKISSQSWVYGSGTGHLNQFSAICCVCVKDIKSNRLWLDMYSTWQIWRR